MDTTKLFKIASAGLLTAALISTAGVNAKGKKVQCNGANGCKGKSACKTDANECAGKNACGGQGFVWAKSEKACTAMKAKMEKKDAPAAAAAEGSAPNEGEKK